MGIILGIQCVEYMYVRTHGPSTSQKKKNLLDFLTTRTEICMWCIVFVRKGGGGQSKEKEEKKIPSSSSNFYSPLSPFHLGIIEMAGHILFGPSPRASSPRACSLFRLWRGKIMHFEIIHHIFDFLNLKSITKNTHTYTLEVSLSWYVIFDMDGWGGGFSFFLGVIHSNQREQRKRKKRKKRYVGRLEYWHCTWCCRCAFLRSRSLGWESGSRREYLWRIGRFW